MPLEKRIIQIAIDGPPCEKSTLAKYLAKTLCINYLDTGQCTVHSPLRLAASCDGTDNASIKNFSKH
jgi:cytidylate kinase